MGNSFLNKSSSLYREAGKAKLIEEVKPVKIYQNFTQDRASLIKENNGKVGVYCLVNLVNGHFYIGSSSNLAVRMRNYLNNSFLNQSQNANML